MKKVIKLTAFVFLFCGFWACDRNDNIPDTTPLEVKYSDIAGIWQLTQWNGGEINDGRYFYMILDRKERTFDIYQNFDSAKSRHLTGSFELNYDEDKGSVIKGMYDHTFGEYWNNFYIITELKNGSMTWVVEDDAQDVSVYTGVNSVPDDILDGTRGEL